MRGCGSRALASKFCRGYVAVEARRARELQAGISSWEAGNSCCFQRVIQRVSEWRPNRRLSNDVGRLTSRRERLGELRMSNETPFQHCAVLQAMERAAH